MNILFVCKYNRFRSKIAEGIFNKLNKNQNHKTQSAGIIRGVPVSKLILELSKQNNLNITDAPQGLSEELINWADEIIIVADNVPPKIFKFSAKTKKLVVWKIKDARKNIAQEIQSIIEKISRKVERLVSELK